MRRGKEIAQGSHASMAFLTAPLRGQNLDGSGPFGLELTEEQRQWIAVGMAKVCLRVNSEEELLSYHKKALEAGLTSHVITDSGRTEFGGVPTITACAIGPHILPSIDAITGDLTPY